MKLILLIADAKGWIFDRHCTEIKKRIPKYNFDIKFTWCENAATYKYQSYDIIYQLDPMQFANIPSPKAKTIIGLRNEFMYGGTIDGAIKLYHEYFEPKCRMFHVVNKNQYKVMSSINPSIPLLLVQHGVDTDCFRIKNKKQISDKEPLIIGISGSQTSIGEKGFSLVEAACKITGSKILTAKQNLSSGHLSKEQMSDYYNKIDIYCCMSKSEGLNNCIMEAGATAVPVITTKTGAVEEMIKDGENGFIIERNVPALVDKLNYFKNNRDKIKSFGESFQKTIVSEWSWDVKIKDFKRMFEIFFKSF